MNVRFRMILPWPETGAWRPPKEHEPMIVCECTGTTDGTIRALARDGVSTVAEVTRRCGAGGCCQSCRPAIKRILRQTAKEESASTIDAPASAHPVPV